MLKRLWSANRGAAAMEFALVAPLFFLCLFGLVEFGRLTWIRLSLQHAADQASRYVLTHADASTGQVAAVARDAVSGVASNLVTVNVTQETSGGTTFVVIDVSFDFEPIVGGMLSYGPIPLLGRSRLPL